MMRFLRRIFGAAAPDDNAAMLGGPGKRTVSELLRQRGHHIENLGPPPPGVTRLPGRGVDGFKGLFGNQLQETENYRRRQQSQPNSTGEMEQYLKNGGIYRDR
jgi:hypothetical protein